MCQRVTSIFDTKKNFGTFSINTNKILQTKKVSSTENMKNQPRRIRPGIPMLEIADNESSSGALNIKPNLQIPA